MKKRWQMAGEFKGFFLSWGRTTHRGNPTRAATKSSKSPGKTHTRWIAGRRPETHSRELVMVEVPSTGRERQWR